MPDPPRPPVAPARPTTLRHLDDERVDPWFWLRERDDPDVLAYLEAENAYTDASLARHRAAPRAAVRGDRRSRPPDRRFGAGAARRLRVLLADHRGPAVRRALPAPGRHSRVSPTPMRRPGATPGETVVLDENELARRPRLLRGRRPRDQSRPDPRRVHHRHDAAVSATTCASAPSTPTRRRRPPRRRDRRVLRRRVGERRPHRALHPTRRRDAARGRCGDTPSARRATTTCSSTRKTTTGSSCRSSAPAPAASW